MRDIWGRVIVSGAMYKCTAMYSHVRPCTGQEEQILQWVWQYQVKECPQCNQRSEGKLCGALNMSCT